MTKMYGYEHYGRLVFACELSPDQARVQKIIFSVICVHVFGVGVGGAHKAPQSLIRRQSDTHNRIVLS